MRGLLPPVLDAPSEPAFLEHRLRTTGPTLALVAAAAAVAWLAFIPLDRSLAADDTRWLLAAGWRVTAASSLLLAAWLLRRRPAWLATAAGARALTAVGVGCVAAFLGVCAARPAAFANLLASAIGFGVAAVLFAPLPLRTRVLLVGALDAGFVVIAAPSLGATRLALLLGTTLACCTVAAVHLERSAQLAWAALRRTQRLATEDPLTGLPNRRAWFERVDRVFAGADRTRRPVALVVLDVDRFKAVNDVHGHAAGDDVLEAVADALRAAVRYGDVVGRIGGEEFAVLLPGADADDARRAAERVRRHVADLAVAVDGTILRVTASVGAAVRRGDEDERSVLRRADAAMYRAKAAGGDRSVVDGPEAALV